MHWATGFSTAANLHQAANAATKAAISALAASPHLLLLFSTTPLVLPSDGDWTNILPTENTMGLQVQAIWNPGRGWIKSPAVLALAATLPGIHGRPLHLLSGVIPDGDAPPAHWRGALGFGETPPAALFLFGTGQSAHLTALLPGLATALPTTPCLGGVVGGGKPGRAKGQLLLDGVIPAVDAMGLALEGPLQTVINTISCYRPLGTAHRITRVAGTDLVSLDGIPVRDILQTEVGPKADSLAAEGALLVEIGSQPPDAKGNLPTARARSAFTAQSKVHVMEPKDLRPGMWARFCLADPEVAGVRAAKLAHQLKGRVAPTGGLVISCSGARSADPALDPAAILAGINPDIPCPAIMLNAQLAGDEKGPLLHGQSLVLARFFAG